MSWQSYRHSLLDFFFFFHYRTLKVCFFRLLRNTDFSFFNLFLLQHLKPLEICKIKLASYSFDISDSAIIEQPQRQVPSSPLFRHSRCFDLRWRCGGRQKVGGVRVIHVEVEPWSFSRGMFVRSHGFDFRSFNWIWGLGFLDLIGFGD